MMEQSDNNNDYFEFEVENGGTQQTKTKSAIDKFLPQKILGDSQQDQEQWVKDSFATLRTPLFSDQKFEKGPLYKFAFDFHRTIVLEADQGSLDEVP